MSEIEKLLSDGQRSLNLDNPKEALSFYQKVLDQNPAHLEALLKKGNNPINVFTEKLINLS